MKSTPIKARYEIIMYDGQQFSKNVITKEDFLSMKRDAVDHVLAIDLGLWCFRAADGQWIEKDLSEVSIGEVSLKLLECMQCEPGEYFTPIDIAEITQINSLRNPNNLSARLRALRISHLESAKHQNFFQSKRTGGMGVCWNPERSFLILTKISNTQ
jgi:hypothetical protein